MQILHMYLTVNLLVQKQLKKSVKSNKDLNKEIVKEAKSTTKLKIIFCFQIHYQKKTSKTNKPKKKSRT